MALAEAEATTTFCKKKKLLHAFENHVFAKLSLKQTNKKMMNIL